MTRRREGREAHRPGLAAPQAEGRRRLQATLLTTGAGQVWAGGGGGGGGGEAREEVWRTTRRDNLRGVIVSRSFSLACSVLDSRYATGLIGTKHYCGFDSEACLGSPHSELVCVVCTR